MTVVRNLCGPLLSLLRIQCPYNRSTPCYCDLSHRPVLPSSHVCSYSGGPVGRAHLTVRSHCIIVCTSKQPRGVRYWYICVYHLRIRHCTYPWNQQGSWWQCGPFRQQRPNDACRSWEPHDESKRISDVASRSGKVEGTLWACEDLEKDEEPRFLQACQASSA